MKIPATITAEFVAKLNSLPAAQMEKVLDRMTIGQLEAVFALGLKMG